MSVEVHCFLNGGLFLMKCLLFIRLLIFLYALSLDNVVEGPTSELLIVLALGKVDLLRPILSS